MSADQATTGYLRLGRVFGVRIQVHVAAVVLGVAGAIAGLGVAVLALVSLLFIHEFGHAFIARRRGFFVTRIDIHALGGRCVCEGDITDRWSRALIAWGGVLFQALLLLPFLAWLVFFPVPNGVGFVDQILLVFVPLNALMILSNLVPLAPLDGALAWRVLPMWVDRRRAEQDAALQSAERQEERRMSVARTRAAARGFRVIDGGRDEDA